MNLDYHFAVGHHVMMHVGIHKGEASGAEGRHLAFVKFVTHSNFKISSNHCDVFAMRVPVRGNFVTTWHFQTYGEISRGSGWITFQDRQLSARRQGLWRWSVFYLVRSKRILRWSK